VVATRVMAEYLQQTVERMAREFAGEPRLYFTKATTAYREGISHRLYWRLYERRRKQDDEARAKQAEEATRRAHPAYAGSSTALTILDVRQAEQDANDDYVFGEGFSARRRAREAAAAERQRVALEEAARLEAENPEEFARIEAEKQAAEAKERKRQESRDKRRKMWEPRSSTYYRGYDDGAKISLDQQIDRPTEMRRIA
jgi:hypothetical protein